MNDRRLEQLLTDATELLDRCLPVLRERLGAMTEAQNGWPPGRGFDGDGRGSTVTFCEVHEQERCECGAGTTYAARSDRTGEAALRPDKAAEHRKRIEAALRSIGSQAEDVVRLMALYGPRSATDSERRATVADNERLAGCVSCRRTSVAAGVERWEPVFRDDLCRWCYDWRRSTGAVPVPVELERHHRGQRVSRPA